MRNFLLATTACLWLSSCYTVKIFPSNSASPEFTGLRKKAVILHTGLKKEKDILTKSGIFDFTTDSTDAAAVKIKLLPTEYRFTCGQPILLSAFTLGQFPVILPEHSYFRFEEISGDSTTEKVIPMLMGRKYWFWNMFVIKKNYKKKAGKLLAMEYR